MQSPPILKNENNQERTVGFEIEFASLTLEETLEVVQNVFGGKIKKEHSALAYVNQSDIGDFRVELDAIPLQKIAQKTREQKGKAAPDFMDDISVNINEAISSAGAVIVPLEIVTPPVPLSKMDKLEEMCTLLCKAGAKGTRDSFYYAFGLHINPEASSLNEQYILKILQSFLLLEPWLKKLHAIDITRKITSFIDPFPKEYLELVLDADYAPSMEAFIRDYHRFNPTRNRSLDMLPLFAEMNESLVRKLYGEEEKINKRPTFHYRLPNCELQEGDWSLDQEWSRWLHVERLADNEEKLHQLINTWQRHQEKWFSFESSWIKEVSRIMNEEDEGS